MTRRSRWIALGAGLALTLIGANSGGVVGVIMFLGGLATLYLVWINSGKRAG